MNSPNSGASQHGNDQFQDHGHIDGNSVTLGVLKLSMKVGDNIIFFVCRKGCVSLFVGISVQYLY